MNTSDSQKQPSFFDICDSRAGICKAETRGFYYLFVVVLTLYLMVSSYLKFTDSGKFIESDFFHLMTQDLRVVVLMWPALVLYSFLAFVLQLLVLRGFPHTVAVLVQLLSHCVVFCVFAQVSVARSWWFSQNIFVSIVMFTAFMKMHSYLRVNQELKLAHEADHDANRYPSHITFCNFCHFLIVPALVYEPEFPRMRGIRPWYSWPKFGLMLLRLFSLYILISDFLLPIVMTSAGQSFLNLFSRLIFPMFILYIMVFLILFDDILNLFAELSGYANREFYQDWWNAPSYEEFNRKWNRPVHLFLFKHVYQEMIVHGYSKRQARYTTFLFSAFCHEIILAVACRMVTPYLFGMMMYQFPLIMLQKVTNDSNLRMLGFWLTFLIGPPILVSLYLIASNAKTS